jgi:hypothetical protein
MQNFHHEKQQPKVWAASVIFNKLSEVNTSPRKENFLIWSPCNYRYILARVSVLLSHLGLF